MQDLQYLFTWYILVVAFQNITTGVCFSCYAANDFSSIKLNAIFSQGSRFSWRSYELPVSDAKTPVKHSAKIQALCRTKYNPVSSLALTDNSQNSRDRVSVCYSFGHRQKINHSLPLTHSTHVLVIFSNFFAFLLSIQSAVVIFIYVIYCTNIL